MAISMTTSELIPNAHRNGTTSPDSDSHRIKCYARQEIIS